MNTYINGLIRLDWTCQEQNDGLSAKYLVLGWKMGLAAISNAAWLSLFNKRGRVWWNYSLERKNVSHDSWKAYV